MRMKLKSKKGNGKIGVLTSGGDAPGMNAALRAVVRTAIFHGYDVVGIRNGYDGLMKGNVVPLTLRSVGNIIQRGGTFLGTSRSKEFRTKDGRARAFNLLKAWDVSALITLGGDGTMMGAGILSKEYPIQVIGVPCTIDNDLFGTDFSIGYDTAVNTAVESIDKIRDTADSHGRIFVIEVMGRNTGHLALETALAVGAEYVVIPEAPLKTADLIRKIQEGVNRGKTGSIIIVAEKDRPGWALTLAEVVEKSIKRDVRAAVLGHLQRGGSPSSSDRNLASRLGARAVELIAKNKTRLMVGMKCGQIQEVPFSSVVGKRRHADLEKLSLVDRLSI
ncbi:MAG: ATP-dependent 6-phosphofructokinase [Bacteriovoracaceae bacterium]|nr:ATP-dependent 6-phosphofructokinase [Bacteriovoracaceae bacterium]